MSVRQVYHHGHAQTHTHKKKTHPPIHTLTTPTTPTTHNTQTHNTRNTHTQHTTQRARAPAGWPAGRPPTHPLADKKINIQRLLISQTHSLIRAGFPRMEVAAWHHKGTTKQKAHTAQRACNKTAPKAHASAHPVTFAQRETTNHNKTNRSFVVSQA